MKKKRVSPGSLPEWIKTHKNYDGEDCLHWPFATAGRGYGVIMICRKSTYVHRIMCEHRHGPPPTKKHEAAHSCGNGHLACVNPKHLTWKTRTENMADKVAHGTHIFGRRCHNYKLTSGNVGEIRSSTLSHEELAREFGVSRWHIINIRNGLRRTGQHEAAP